ncbi:polysaccharide ABC transporter ATP-binding protein [Pontibacter chitinilyticus]|uniref:ABC transporter ATP-binding protein n=1 Tax=Pontibacter chitinilyticus TaxID=2674989 RepID=UPI00321BA924
MSTTIKVENLSKQYRLGELGTGTISHDINRWWHKVRGKEDPYLKVGEVNDRTSKGNSEYVWVLRDINFDVKQGEVLGVIGKNGAGKSTLLKLLSRVTTPTTGSIKAKGRIASLLEVGTGFHDELTGRENIFLNGAILGMTKAEIRSKLDEIIDFSGTERYIDTPVKRYSSGMRVRLAFAVAAHLEPEILIVDEVLAVGDAEFQNKAIGKMQEVSQGGGRTVLFVSHSMAAINKLCTSCVLLDKGTVNFIGATDEAVARYLASPNRQTAMATFPASLSEAYYESFSVIPGDSDLPNHEVDVRASFKIKCKYIIKKNFPGLTVSFSVFNSNGSKVFYCPHTNDRSGEFEAEVTIPGMFLVPGRYYISAGIHIPNIQMFDLKEEALGFEIVETGSKHSNLAGRDIGSVIVNYDWTVKHLNH